MQCPEPEPWLNSDLQRSPFDPQTTLFAAVLVNKNPM
jgi:hypothetical protein